MKKLLILFFAFFINNVTCSIILINKIENFDLSFIIKYGSAYMGPYNLINENLTIWFVGRKPIIAFYNVDFDEIILRVKNGNEIIASKTIKKDFFIEKQEKLENENKKLLDIFEDLKVSEISKQYGFCLKNDKVFHILFGKDEQGLENIVLKEISSELGELTDAAIRSCVIL